MIDAGEVIVYRRHRMRVYRQGRWRWNVEVVGYNYMGGDPHGAFSRDRAVRKAQRTIDRDWAWKAEREAIDALLYPGERHRPPDPSWILPE